MLVLITYDVSTQDAAGKSRLRKVAKECVNYGQRVQNSVFECILDSFQLLLLKDRLVSLINEKEDPVVFLLWGNNAIKKKNLITNKKHLILTSVHPSPLSASRGFFGSKPFSKINNFLISVNKKPIDWQIENI